MGSSKPVIFTEHEAGILSAIVRDAVRKNWKNRRRAEEKFADSFSPEPYVNRESILFDIYRKLGKNPANIGERGDR